MHNNIHVEQPGFEMVEEIKVGMTNKSMMMAMAFILLLFLFCSLALLRIRFNTNEDGAPLGIEAEAVLCGPTDQSPPINASPQVEQRKAPTSDGDDESCLRQEDVRGIRIDGQLPQGIIQRTTDLEFRSLTAKNPIAEEQQIIAQYSHNLLAIPVGFKQKEMIDKIINKFSLKNFTIMLFHYDGTIDKWKEFSWNDQVLHVAAINQTKWWFAKRFLHPDIVAPYKYIFLWDEDISIDHFDPHRYLSIVEREGFEISQPALDLKKSEIHHYITARQAKQHVHSRIYSSRGGLRCFDNSTQPPCTGWVEMMVPVFSQMAWRCIWYMIQNDLVHGWGMDMKLGYCVKGDRSQKVGVVDDEYVVHHGIPSLGGQSYEKNYSTPATDQASRDKDTLRGEVRKRSYEELRIFNRRWNSAVREDRCWADPYQ